MTPLLSAGPARLNSPCFPGRSFDTLKAQSSARPERGAPSAAKEHTIMPALLVEVTRGDRVESSHYGDIAVADPQGNLVASLGDPETWVCMRSMAKPIQALPLITTGAAQAFGFGSEELALFSGSLNGQDFQVAIVEKVLARLGLTACPPAVRHSRPLASAHGPGPGQVRPVPGHRPQQLRRQTRRHASPLRPPRLAGGALSGHPTPGPTAHSADHRRGYRSPGTPDYRGHRRLRRAGFLCSPEPYRHGLRQICRGGPR